MTWLTEEISDLLFIVQGTSVMLTGYLDWFDFDFRSFRQFLLRLAENNAVIYTADNVTNNNYNLHFAILAKSVNYVSLN